MTRADLLEQLATKTAEMRQAQKAYFAASRSNSFRGDELSTSKRLEREVDTLLRQLAGVTHEGPVQRGLFDEGP